jgi:hypothetical protein
MHFFRSEEHLRNWAGFDAEKEGGIISLSDLVKLTSIDHFQKRLEPDYISHYLGVGDVMKRLQEIGKRDPYWLP